MEFATATPRRVLKNGAFLLRARIVVTVKTLPKPFWHPRTYRQQEHDRRRRRSGSKHVGVNLSSTRAEATSSRVKFVLTRLRQKQTSLTKIDLLSNLQGICFLYKG